MADVVNTTLDLDTTLRRVSELVRKVIDYQIFAILLLNEKTQELHIRFQMGYPQEVAERYASRSAKASPDWPRSAAKPCWWTTSRRIEGYIGAVPEVRSELAVPLIVKNRVIGVINIESVQPNYFTEEHKRLLTLIGSRMAVGIENARLHTRTTRQARTLLAAQ